MQDTTQVDYPRPRVSDAQHRHRIHLFTHVPQPCRRYGCGGCLGETAIMINPTFSLGEA
ncbi:MAG: hypothetical protein SPJ05_03385 [Candidatus Limisoma sp.]|nr:hypothetical protein [Candidatus Limisoma sp.]MDY5999281.1 hypothetical protein [Candidatus Limisoma sp.]